MKLIERSWRDAPFIHIDPDCSHYELEMPLILGPFISLGFHGFGYYRGKTGWIEPKDHEYGVIIRGGAAVHPRVTVDRGSWRHTEIGFNARLNAGSFIGHNVKIGYGLLLGVGSSISGSSTVGDMVEVWSHAYIAQRCEIGDRAIVGARSNVLKGSKIGKDEVWFNHEKPYATFQRMVDEPSQTSHFERVQRRLELRKPRNEG